MPVLTQDTADRSQPGYYDKNKSEDPIEDSIEEIEEVEEETPVEPEEETPVEPEEETPIEPEEETPIEPEEEIPVETEVVEETFVEDNEVLDN